MSHVRVRGLLSALLLVAAGVVLSAHLTVVKSAPAKGETLTTPPAIVQVWFNQNPSMPVSALIVEGEQGKAELGEVAAGDDRSLVAKVTKPLAPGKYTLRWQTAGNDGHVLKGEIPFTVAAAR